MPAAAPARDQSFADLFALAECDDEGFYWHADGAVSAAWLTHPISAEHLDGDARHTIADTFGQAVANLPPGSTVQIICRAVPNVDWALANYLKVGNSSHKWIHQYEVAKITTVRSWTKGLKDVLKTNVGVKDIQVMIVITIYQSTDNTIKQIWEDVRDAVTAPTPSELGLPPLAMTKTHRRTLDAVQGLAVQVRSDRAAMEKAFMAMGLPFVRAQQQQMIRFVRSLIDPADGPTDPVILDSELFLAEQVCRRRVEIVEGGRYVHCNGIYQAMLSVETYPDRIFAGVLSLNSQAFEDDQSIIDFLGDGTLTVSCKVAERTEVLPWLERREQHTGGRASDRVEAKVAFDEVQSCKDWVKNKNRAMTDMSISIKVCAPSPFECDQKAKEMQALFQKLQIALRVEDTDVKTVWCEHLPGGYNKSCMDSGQRVRRKRDIVFAACAPMYLSGRGSAKFAHLAFNTHFEPYGFDNFAHKRSFNIGVVGESGSGKSNQIYNIVLDNLRIDTCRAYIIDYGGSFATLTSLLAEEGCDAALSLSHKQPSNTFAGPADVTIPMLLQWLPSLALNENEPFDTITYSKVEEALRIAYRRARRHAQPFRDVHEIATRYPGYFPTNARKRFRFAFPSKDQAQLVIDALKGDEANRPRFSVFYIVRIRSFMQDKVNTPREIRRLSELPQDKRTYLEANFTYLEEDATGPYVLTTNPGSINLQERQKIDSYVDRTEVIAEVERAQDLASLITTGLSIIFDGGWIATQTERIRASLSARFGEGHPDAQKYLAEDLKRLDVQEYYRDTDGVVDLQGEIIFSDFIHEAKSLNDPALSAFVSRLAPWYGSGTYADFFDRRGGIDLSKYRCVIWDFKPIWGAEPKFICAMLGSVMTRIQVYCDSLTTLGLRKFCVLDEKNEFSKKCGDMVVRYLDRITLQARKNNYCALVGSQKFEHFADSGVQGINLLDQFQHFLIGSQLSSSITKLKERFDFSDEQCYVASQARMEPGKYADFLLYIPATHTCEIMRSIQTPFEYWLKTTTATERELRQQRIAHYQRELNLGLAEATVMAVKELAKQFPRGQQAATLVEIQ